MNEKQTISADKSSEKSMRGVDRCGSRSYAGGFIIEGWVDMRHNINPIINHGVTFG